MRKISIKLIYDKVRTLCKEANIYLNCDVLQALKYYRMSEQSSIACDILDMLIENAELAVKLQKPLCQDTGIGIFFIEIGQDVIITDGNIKEALWQGLSSVYLEQPYRLSVVKDPYYDRSNTNDNLPPIIHYDIVAGDNLKITFMPKGGGAENMSAIRMFTPLSDIEDIKEFIVDTVRTAGGKPCPPIIVGVGIGGSFDNAALLSKKALLRPLDTDNEVSDWAHTEKELLTAINNLNIGPMGLGGKTTALGVNILTAPCHIASLPVAVNLQCHSHRYKTVII